MDISLMELNPNFLTKRKMTSEQMVELEGIADEMAIIQNELDKLDVRLQNALKPVGEIRNLISRIRPLLVPLALKRSEVVKGGSAAEAVR